MAAVLSCRKCNTHWSQYVVDIILKSVIKIENYYINIPSEVKKSLNISFAKKKKSVIAW